MDAEPPPLPKPESLTPHWLWWLSASIFMPAMPFLVYGKNLLDHNNGIGLYGVALLVQLTVSIHLARGIADRRQFGMGGIIGLSVVFMMASVAIGCGIFFIACVSSMSGSSFR